MNPYESQKRIREFEVANLASNKFLAENYYPFSKVFRHARWGPQRCSKRTEILSISDCSFVPNQSDRKSNVRLNRTGMMEPCGVMILFTEEMCRRGDLRPLVQLPSLTAHDLLAQFA